MKKPYFISEVSSNHSRDIERSKEFIKVSKDIGCDAVKFQLFKIDQLFAPEILAKSEEHRRRKDWELPIFFFKELSNYAHDIGISFTCTPFYLEAVKELEPYVDFYKIASYELLWDDLIIECFLSIFNSLIP
jgi:N-acetylneuraminate synthase